MGVGLSCSSLFTHNLHAAAANDFSLSDGVISQIATLSQKWALRHACAALLQEPPVSPTVEVQSPYTPPCGCAEVDCTIFRAGGRCRPDQEGPTAYVSPVRNHPLPGPLSALGGVQQGDPLRPVLFTIAIHAAVLEARRGKEVAHSCGTGLLPKLHHGVFGNRVNSLSGKVRPPSRYSPHQTSHRCQWQPTAISSSWSRHWPLVRLAAAQTSAQAKALLLAIDRFPDPEPPLCLLRSCVGWASILCSFRTAPVQPLKVRTAGW